MGWDQFDFFAEFDPMAEHTRLIVGFAKATFDGPAIDRAGMLAQIAASVMLLCARKSFLVDRHTHKDLHIEGRAAPV